MRCHNLSATIRNKLLPIARPPPALGGEGLCLSPNPVGGALRLGPALWDDRFLVSSPGRPARTQTPTPRPRPPTVCNEFGSSGGRGNACAPGVLHPYFDMIACMLPTLFVWGCTSRNGASKVSRRVERDSSVLRSEWRATSSAKSAPAKNEDAIGSSLVSSSWTTARRVSRRSLTSGVHAQVHAGEVDIFRCISKAAPVTDKYNDLVSFALNSSSVALARFFFAEFWSLAGRLGACFALALGFEATPFGSRSPEQSLGAGSLWPASVGGNAARPPLAARSAAVRGAGAGLLAAFGPGAEVPIGRVPLAGVSGSGQASAERTVCSFRSAYFLLTISLRPLWMCK